MRILVIVPEQLPIPPIKGGSVETVTYNIFKRMARQHRITIISRSHPSLPARSSAVGGNLRFLRINQANPLSYLKAALKSVGQQHFDLIQIENRPVFVPLVRRTFPQTPIVLSLHSLTFMSRLSIAKANTILKQVNGVTSVVGFVTKTMQKHYPKFARKFKTALLGCDTEKFRPQSTAYKHRLRRHWGVANSYNLLFVGRMVPKKGLDTLVRAVAQLQKTRQRTQIVAVGSAWPGVKEETPYIRKTRLLAKRLGVPLRCTGYVPPAHVNKMYHLGDIFVCPTRYKEGFALVNSEAMSSEIPIIASKRGGIKEVVEHNKSGLLINDYNSPRAFARAIESLRSSPQTAKKLAKAGRRRVVRRFSWANTVRTLVNHYKKLTNAR